MPTNQKEIEERLNKKKNAIEKIDSLSLNEFNELGQEILDELEVVLSEEKDAKFFSKLFSLPAELTYLKMNNKILDKTLLFLLPAISKVVASINIFIDMCDNQDIVGVEHKKAVRRLVIGYTKAVYSAGFAIPIAIDAAKIFFTGLNKLCPKIKIFDLLANKLEQLHSKVNKNVITTKVRDLDVELKVLDRSIAIDKSKVSTNSSY